MTISIKLILACLTWLTIALTINSQHTIRKIGSPEIVVLSKNKNVQLGYGVESDQLPILVYSKNTSYIDISIHIRPKKHCNFTFFPRDNNMVKVKTIKQLGHDNKVIFIWDEERKVGKNSKFSGSFRKFATMISIIHMNTCTNTKNLEFLWDLNVSKNQISVVLFENNFDVFISKNGVVSTSTFDVDGNQIGIENSFPINFSWHSIHPVSSKLQAMGYFIIKHDAGGKILKFVKSDGSTNKLLIKFSSLEILTYSDKSLYSICWTSNDPNGNILVNCKQFDDFGYEKFSSQEYFEFDRLIDVISLSDGGVALFAWNYNEEKLYVVEMRPSPSQLNTWSYSMEREIGNARVMNFNEKDHTFVLAYEDNEIVQHGKGLEQSVALQKFSLSSNEV